MRCNEIFESQSFDDEDEVNSPDREKVPHILIQLKKALDVNGNKPIVFKDGSREKIALKDIQKFVKIYSSLKPDAREKMQAMATDSKDMFYKVIGM
jgi:predicted nicotinamide N-methyase